MKIRKNSWTTIARLALRDLRRWLFPNDKDDKMKVAKAKRRAKELDHRKLSVVGCQPVVTGCFLSLLHTEMYDDFTLKVFSSDVVPKNGGMVKVGFSDEPHEMLYSIFGHRYRFKVGSYLRVAKIYY